jgi:hypothetical protein
VTLDGTLDMSGTNAVVTVQNSVGIIDTTYAGSVDFASTDSTANLPTRDTFMASDRGTQTLSRFVLDKKVKPSITATDALCSSITVGLSVGVT